MLTETNNAEIEKLKEQIQQEQAKMDLQKKAQENSSKEQQVVLEHRNSVIAQLQQQLEERQAEEKRRKDLIAEVQVIDYIHIDQFLVTNFFFQNIDKITNQLKRKLRPINYFTGIPGITVKGKDPSYVISVIGVENHHEEFKQILRRIQSLSNVTKSAEAYYARYLNRSIRSVLFIMNKKIRSSAHWKSYLKYFQYAVNEQKETFLKLFADCILEEAQRMVEECITDARFQSSALLRESTNSFIEDKPFIAELELLKHRAFDEFITQNVFSQPCKFEKKPSNAALRTLNELINQVKNEFKTNKKYIGCDLSSLNEIPKLLKRIILYYRCFLLELPLFESAGELLGQIEKNTVITIATSTGSGTYTILVTGSLKAFKLIYFRKIDFVTSSTDC